ncbi:MAG: polysaccharide deacetylase family protein [Steroidobacteraceae bacterium]
MRVLTYHRFTSELFDPVSIHPAEFARQLDWLTANVELLDAKSFDAVMAGGRSLSRDAVLITVDDAHSSFYEKAYPLLCARAVPVLLFICPALIGEEASSGSSEFMSWRQLAEVSLSYVTIASHGFRHHSLGRMEAQTAERDITQAKTTIEKRLSISNAYFAFPFGTAQDFSEDLVIVLRRHGYRYAFTSCHGACAPRSARTLLPRIKIESGESIHFFRNLVRGHLDIWSIVDTLAWRLQQRGRL